MSCMAVVVFCHNAGTEHVGFSPTRQPGSGGGGCFRGKNVSFLGTREILLESFSSVFGHGMAVGIVPWLVHVPSCSMSVGRGGERRGVGRAVLVVEQYGAVVMSARNYHLRANGTEGPKFGASRE